MATRNRGDEERISDKRNLLHIGEIYNLSKEVVSLF